MRRRILFVMQLPPPVHGVSVMNQIIRDSRLINESFDCYYVNLATASALSDIQKFAFVKVFRTAAIFLRVVAMLMARRYAYVYVTPFPWGGAFYKDAFICLLVRLFRQRPILHLHTFGFVKNARGSAAARFFCRQMFRKSDVICLSENLVGDIPAAVGGDVIIVPNGIPQVNFVNTYQPKEVPDILYLSALIKGKGVMLLVAAASILQKKGYRFRVRIAGPEADVTYDEIRAAVSSHGLADFCTLLGPVYGAAKENEFRNADIFVLPSNYDTFGLVLLEAMQFGVPCISTPIGAIPEVIGGGCGLLMREITAEELAECLAKLIESRMERVRMSGNAFSHFQANFTQSIFEQRMKGVLSGDPALRRISTVRART